MPGTAAATMEVATRIRLRPSRLALACSRLACLIFSGMKSSCISYGRRIDIFSKTEDANQWSSVYLDLDEIANGGFRDANGNLTSPQAQTASLPEWIAEYAKSRFSSFDHGTAVVVSKIDLDRLSF